jgi:hypothetical protein
MPGTMSSGCEGLAAGAPSAGSCTVLLAEDNLWSSIWLFRLGPSRKSLPNLFSAIDSTRMRESLCGTKKADWSLSADNRADGVLRMAAWSGAQL